ncbi:MAG: four helix bundle protein [Clostridia bacterium]|nr:four helix bundle protein [Clostridia bacterium]
MKPAGEADRLSYLLPTEESFSLAGQMRGAGTSVPCNIAEGYSRGTDRELLRFLSTAYGSLAEIRT